MPAVLIFLQIPYERCTANCSWHWSHQGLQSWSCHLIPMWFGISSLTALCLSPRRLNEGNNRTQLSIMRPEWVMRKRLRMSGALPGGHCLACSHHLINIIWYLCLTEKSVWKRYKVHFQRTETSAYFSSYIQHCTAQTVQQKKLRKSWRKSNFFFPLGMLIREK